MTPSLGGVFLALLPLLCCTRIADAVETPKLALGLFVLALGLSWKGLPSRFPRGPLTVCIVGFVFSLLVSYFFQGLPEGGMQCVEVLVAGLFYLIWRSGLWGNPEEWTSVVLWGWWGSALYSWMQRLGVDPLEWGHPELSQARTIGGLGNPNFLAFYLAVLAPLAWVEFVGAERKSRARRIGAGALWMAATLALILTVTRASWLALASSSIVLILGAWRWHPRLGKPLAATLVASLLLAPFVFRVKVSEQENMTVAGRAGVLVSTKEESAQVRLLLWRAAWLEFLQRPLLGWGEGWFPHRALFHRENEPMSLRPAQRVPENPHNQYLEILIHGGLLSFTFYCGAGVLALRIGVRRSAQSPRQLALLAGLVAFAVNSLFIDAPFTLQIVLVWLLASLQEFEGSRSWARGSAALAGILLLAWSLTLVYCERLLWLGDAFQEIAKASKQPLPPQALQFYQQAAWWGPPWRVQAASMRQIYQGSPSNRSLLLRLSTLHPEDAWLQRTLAIELESGGGESPDVPAITQAWQRATALDPFNPAFFYFQSRWLCRIGDFQGALDSIDRSLEIYPARQEAHYQRALVLHLAGREEEALREWTVVLRLDPSLAERRPW